MQSEQLREPERKPPVSDFFRSLRVHFGGHRARAETRTVAGGCLPGRTRGGVCVAPCRSLPSSSSPGPRVTGCGTSQQAPPNKGSGHSIHTKEQTTRTACYLVCILTGSIIGGKGRSPVLRFILGGSSMGKDSFPLKTQWLSVIFLISLGFLFTLPPSSFCPEDLLGTPGLRGALALPRGWAGW